MSTVISLECSMWRHWACSCVHRCICRCHDLDSGVGADRD